MKGETLVQSFSTAGIGPGLGGPSYREIGIVFETSKCT